MPRPKIVGNDEIQRASKSFISRKAENAASAGIPEADGPGAIGRNDRIRRRCQDRFSQPGRDSHDFFVRLEFVPARTFGSLQTVPIQLWERRTGAPSALLSMDAFTERLR